MAGIDKAAIAVSIAITAIFLGVAAAMGAAQDAGPAVSTPKPVVVEEKMMEEPEKTVEVEIEEEVMMEEEPVMEEEVMMEEEPVMEEPAGPTTHTVEIPVGTSVPGCEETNACYLPADITINAGDTIVWDNVDSAVHTTTAGTPADAQMGVFHSDLIMPGDKWENTFDDADSYDYFCMVHPWMVGTVTVN